MAGHRSLSPLAYSSSRAVARVPARATLRVRSQSSKSACAPQRHASLPRLRPRARLSARRARAPQDGSYKHVFSHPEMVEGLLRDFVQEDWLALIDFSTLEKQGGSYVTDDLREREDDIIWRVRVAGEWLYVYLLIEFQSQMRLETLAAEGPEALRPILRRLGTRLQGPRYASLRRALTVWFARVLLRRLLPGENLPQLHDLGEVEAMLSEHVDEWAQKWKREGERAGKLEGKSDAPKRLLRVRFGDLPPWAQARIDAATLGQLDT